MNVIPFNGSVIVNGKIDLSEIYMNVIIFIPFGIYISMLNYDTCFIKKVVPIATVSLSYEILQFIFAIGASDITDFIGNTCGGILGIGIYAVFVNFIKDKCRANKIINRLASIGTIIMILLLFMLVAMN